MTDPTPAELSSERLLAQIESMVAAAPSAEPTEAFWQHRQRVAAMIEAELGDRYAGSVLAPAVADLYFDPSWQTRHDAFDDRRHDVIVTISKLFERHPPADLVQRLDARLAKLLGWPGQGADAPAAWAMQPFLEPGVGKCLDLLLAQSLTDDVLDVIAQVVTGAHRDAHEDPWPWAPPGARSFGDLGYWNNGRFEVSKRLWKMAELLDGVGRFGYAEFEAMVRAYPYGTFEDARGVGYHDDRVPNTIRPEMRAHAERLLASIVDDPSPESVRLLRQAGRLAGPEHLIRAASYVARFDLGVPNLRVWTTGGTSVEMAVVTLARAESMEPADASAREKVINRLSAYPVRVLTALLGPAPHGRRLLLAAMGREGAAELAEEIARLGGVDTDDWWERARARDLVGRIDLPRLQSAVEPAVAAFGEAWRLEDALFWTFEEARPKARPALDVIRALLAFDPGRVRVDFELRRPSGVLGFALLPLSRGQDEAFERAIELRRLLRDSSRFRRRRRDELRALYRDAMRLLAEHAGFASADALADAVRFAFDEGRLHPHRGWEAGPYRVELTVWGQMPELWVWRGEDPLWSAPVGLRRRRVWAAAERAWSEAMTLPLPPRSGERQPAARLYPPAHREL